MNEWQIPFVALSQDIQYLHVGGLLQQTDAEGMNSRYPFRAHCNTRWQCVSVAAGHLAGCLDRRVCCQRLQDPAVQSASDGLFTPLQRCQSLYPQEATKIMQRHNTCNILPFLEPCDWPAVRR